MIPEQAHQNGLIQRLSPTSGPFFLIMLALDRVPPRGVLHAPGSGHDVERVDWTILRIR